MPEKKIVKNIFIEGPSGKLEAIFNPAKELTTPIFLAVVCHPHPLYEGTMHNKVAVTLAKALSSFGGAVIRFNFRGVMESEGVYDNGEGEMDDVKAAMNFLETKYPEARESPRIVAGFSFGAWVGLRYGSQDDRIHYLIGLGLPLRMFNASYLKTMTKPKLLLYGDKDEFNPIANIEEMQAEIAEPKRVIVISNADHFFIGKQHIITKYIEDWVAEEVLRT